MNEKINEILSQMTIDEKLGQLTQEYATNERIDELCEMAKKGELGSCILASTPWAGNNEQEELFISKLNKLQKASVEDSRLGIPLIYGRDIIHGSKTIFPIPLAQAATWDYELIKEAASVMSAEASADGVHWTFAPMLDVCMDPRWGRIVECPGEDPFLGMMYAKASVDGIQGNNMAGQGKLVACAKHYIGYGASEAGRDKDATEWSEYSLRNRALPAFKEAVEAGVATVMSAFNEISGVPASANRYYLNDVLRNELGFEGFVVSDWDAVKRLVCQGVSDNDETSAVLAVNAGVDMDMCDGLYKNNLKNAMEKGLVSVETIDEAVRRVLKIKMKAGLFQNPYTDEADNSDKIMTEDYLKKAKEVSAHSVVLLKNNGVLPLKKNEKVSVKGQMAEEKASLLGSWHAAGRSSDVISLSEGIKKINGEENTFSYSCGEDGICVDSEFSDVFVLALGEPAYITGEGRTMPDIEISESQVNCARIAKSMGKKVVAVIFAGRPLAITEILPYCDAVLWAWHGGTCCGLAVAEVLYGEFNPCGKLPVTIPRSTGQIPIHYNHQRNEYIKSGYYDHHPYVATNTLSTPLFVFGYGLSYTEFEYSNFECSIDKKNICIKISFDVKNKGNYDGWEIAQCYITDVVASMSRPVKELKAFEKMFIKKDKTKRVTLTVGEKELSFYGYKGNFICEKGDFRIQIGKSCRDIVFEQKINL